MVQARKYVINKRFKGEPKPDDFEIVTYELPPLQNGEVLVKAEWISVDPYQRIYNFKAALPYDPSSFQVGIVEQSKDAKYPVGSRVVSHKGWCNYYIFDAKEQPKKTHKENIYKLPDLKGLSASHAVGALGLPGSSAYYGFLDICKPKAGETVAITGAAGAVGTLVGQIAKIKGCRVIGFAGSDDKVKWLEQELGFDKALNYKTEDIPSALKLAAPNGIDCYFDNVGGELSSIIINHMNSHGRISVCGSISSYNDSTYNDSYNDLSKLPKATVVQQNFLLKELEMKGFIIFNYPDWSPAINEMINWMKAGKIKAKEHVTYGFENIYEAFVGMLAGENFGRAVVKV